MINKLFYFLLIIVLNPIQTTGQNVLSEGFIFSVGEKLLIDQGIILSRKIYVSSQNEKYIKGDTVSSIIVNDRSFIWFEGERIYIKKISHPPQLEEISILKDEIIFEGPIIYKFVNKIKSWFTKKGYTINYIHANGKTITYHITQ